MRRAIALAALLAATSVALAVEPVERITWVVQDVPPHFSFVNGRPPRTPAELGQGEIDGFLRVLLARMPEVRHEFLIANTARFEAMSRSGETLCSALHVRTPQRLEWLYFSHLYPPLLSREVHVIVARERLGRFMPADGKTSPLLLADLLRRDDLRPLIESDRSFGPQIDALLIGRNTRTPELAGSLKGERLLDMLRAGRMDYTLEYPTVVRDYLSRHQLPPDLVALPVAEGTSTQVATVACSRTPQGRRQIEAIDEAVRRLAREPDREAWIREWRGLGVEREDLKRIQTYMDQRARGGARIE